VNTALWLVLLVIVANLGFVAGCGWAAAHRSGRTLKVVK